MPTHAIVFIIIFALIFVILVISFIIYMVAFYSPIKGQNDIYNLPKGKQYQILKEQSLKMIKKLDAVPYEEVKIKSYDGLDLYGKYYHCDDKAPLAILFHGYRSTAIRDFSGGAILCIHLRQNVLLIDQRAHGKSQGHTISFGIKERKDCLSWINYSIDRFGKDVEILLYGISMGASTILLASGLNLPSNVKCSSTVNLNYKTI